MSHLKHDRKTDGLNRPLPAWCAGIFRRSYLRWYHLHSKISGLGKAIAHGFGEEWSEDVDLDKVGKLIEGIRDEVFNSKPFIPCVECQARGRIVTSCICHGRGWLNYRQYVEWRREHNDVSPSKYLARRGKYPRNWKKQKRSP